ncbi:hypothetical protein, partial [Methylobacterium frigidaeris]|uniref:hypothetical protein n=1 Tax=Methylobacterium frigidaeris TaxID=2038277 RepID=UPI001EDDC7AE
MLTLYTTPVVYQYLDRFGLLGRPALGDDPAPEARWEDRHPQQQAQEREISVHGEQRKHHVHSLVNTVV